jgi:VWFA-related protein
MRRIPSPPSRPLVLIASLFLAGTAFAQSSASNDAASTIKTTTRVVLLDIVVTDKSGKPMHGLKANNFTVLEDGKAQQVRGFEERGPTVPLSTPRLAMNLPPNTYTNYVSTQEPGAVSIILFDTLNTERLDLTRARQQLMLYLSKFSHNDRIALFSLDSDLHLIHGFTDDPQALIETAKTLSTKPNGMYSNARGVSESIAQAKEIGLQNNPKMFAAVVNFLWNEQTGKEESRTFVTMQALNQLARSMAVFPGRKNLIWISGGIPFDPSSTDPQMRRTATLLAATQIAVYPIDVRGVPYIGTDGATRDKEAFNPYGGSYDEISGQDPELLSVHQMMSTLANMTGGRAVFGRNDLDGAIRNTVDAGANFYTLAYRPHNTDWNGKFRKITVKTSAPDVKIQCRPGYYAVADPLGAPDLNQTFSLMMQPSSPPSTTLIIKARVIPADGQAGATRIDYLVDVHDLAFNESPDHRQAPDVTFVAAAWDTTGSPKGNVSASFRLPLNTAQFDVLARSGLQIHQEMTLKPGTYQLRLGVLDRLSGKMGTLDVPLSIEPTVANR